MKTAIATLKSAEGSPYSQGRPYENEIEHLKDEGDNDYEKRTWMNRLHTTADGHVFIPPTAFKLCLQDEAQRDSKKIKGEGTKTWTKYFRSGVEVVEPVILAVTKDQVEAHWVFGSSTGTRGGPKRVWKCYPLMRAWGGKVVFLIIDEKIKEEIFWETLERGGIFTGIGVYRPQSGGYFGRFTVEKLDWK